MRVHDESGVPVQGARVCVELRGEEPYVGRVCGTTRSDGSFVAYYVESGQRLVECTPPGGYTAEPGTLARDVEVTKGSRVDVRFVLIRL